MRYRRNIDCLGSEALHDLREALAALYARPGSDPMGFARIAGFHGDPPPAYCRHGAPGFLTWHRAYLQAFEDALRTVDCDVTLPYWDWASGPSTGVPAACREATYVDRAGNTVANPLYAGPRPAGGMTVRRADIDTTSFDDLAASAQTALGQASFASFQAQLNGVHGSVHVRVGGDMSSVPTAGYDPIFFLHHANIDRLWAQWQATHPGPMAADEAGLELAPFNRPFSTQWQTGADVASTEAMGYRYLRWCLRLPPIRIWDLVHLAVPWEVRRQLTSARLHFRIDRLPEQTVEVRAFLGQSRASARSRTVGNEAFAGAVGLFGLLGGAGAPDRVAPAKHRGHDDDLPTLGGRHGVVAGEHDERFDVELDVTAALLALEDDEVPLKLVAVDTDGDAVDADELVISSVDLVVD